jgi:hypothetical protein
MRSGLGPTAHNPSDLAISITCGLPARASDENVWRAQLTVKNIRFAQPRLALPSAV